MKRRIAGIAAGVAGVLAASTLGAVAYVRSAAPPVDGEIALAGLRAPVDVWRDSLGVPRLSAASVHDLAFAQGYVHAQERLWQMELLRRMVDGRLAEAFGPALVPTDRFLRTLGLGRAAVHEEAALQPAVRADLDAYVAGVNAWIADHHGALPPEFLALRLEPEPWTIHNSLSVEQAMAFDLSALNHELALARALARLGPRRARWLAPAYPDWGVTILEGAASSTPPATVPTERSATSPLTFAAPAPPPAAAAALLGAFSITNASNAWVVGGSRTRSGKPILANDMHLALRAPSIWMLMSLHAPGLDVVGMTIPGAPFVIAGHNRAIAWGFTNAYLDDADLFLERLDPADTTRYLTPDGSAPIELLPETVQVRGAEPVAFTVRRTRHGPLLDLDAPPGDSGLERIAAQWASRTPGATLQSIPAMDRAAEWSGFLAAVADFQNPHQNIVYADTAGHIGYVMGGRVPIRGARRPPPEFPVPGWTGEWDWRGELPFADHPRLLDPADGYIVTANNRQGRGGAADLVSTVWEQPFRAQRIREMIVGARASLDAAGVHAMEMDVRDDMAARYRGRAVRAARDAGLTAAADTLAAWDLRASRASRAAALFYTWFQRLRVGAARSLYGDTAGGWFPNDALSDVLERGAAPWEGADSVAAYERIAATAIRSADSLVAGRAWGEINRVVVAHELAASRLLEDLLHLNLGPAPRAGSPWTVDVSHLRGSRPPFTTVAGPSERHVVDMADIDGAGGFILPTGESGLPFDAHYRDQFEPWRDGGLWLIPLDAAAAAARTVHRLRLQPATASR